MLFPRRVTQCCKDCRGWYPGAQVFVPPPPFTLFGENGVCLTSLTYFRFRRLPILVLARVILFSPVSPYGISGHRKHISLTGYIEFGKFFDSSAHVDEQANV